MIRAYGCRISYYAGKPEAYLRYRGIEYELLSMTDHSREIRAGGGAVQSPVVQLADGRWMSDSTPMLAWFEVARCAPAPRSPARASPPAADSNA